MADFPMRKPPPGLFLPKSVRSVNCRLSDRERTHGRGDIKVGSFAANSAFATSVAGGSSSVKVGAVSKPSSVVRRVDILIPDDAGDAVLQNYFGPGYGPRRSRPPQHDLSDRTVGLAVAEGGRVNRGIFASDDGIHAGVTRGTDGRVQFPSHHYAGYIHPEKAVSNRQRAATIAKKARAIVQDEDRAYSVADAGALLPPRHPSLAQQRLFIGRVTGGTVTRCGSIDRFATECDRAAAYARLKHWCVFEQEREDFRSDVVESAANSENNVSRGSVVFPLLIDDDVYFEELKSRMGLDDTDWVESSDEENVEFDRKMEAMKSIARRDMFAQRRKEKAEKKTSYANRYGGCGRIWEAAFYWEFKNEMSDLGFAGYTVSQFKGMAVEFRRKFGGGEFESAAQLDSWYSKFRKRKQLYSSSSKYSSNVDPRVLWQRCHRNWWQFDAVMAEISDRRRTDVNVHGEAPPCVFINADETFLLHQLPAGSIVRERNTALRRSVLTEGGNKGGCSVLCWQSTCPEFNVPPCVMTNFQSPPLRLKRRLVAILEEEFPGALYYPSGNSGKGRAWNDSGIWRTVLEMVLQYIRSFGGPLYVIMFYDSASSHSLQEDVAFFERCRASGLYFVKLAGKTTDLQQPLDCAGFLRSFKSSLKLASLEERRNMQESYATISSDSFPIVYKKTAAKFCTLKSWVGLGFSPAHFRWRVHGDWSSGAGLLSRRLTMLGREAQKVYGEGSRHGRILNRQESGSMRYRFPDIDIKLKGQKNSTASATVVKAASRVSPSDNVGENGLSVGRRRTGPPVKAPSKNVNPVVREYVFRPKRMTPYGWEYRYHSVFGI